jgi:hypothetical protein
MRISIVVRDLPLFRNLGILFDFFHKKWHILKQFLKLEVVMYPVVMANSFRLLPALIILAFVVGVSYVQMVSRSPTASDIEALGLKYKSSEKIADNFYAITLEDDRKIVVYPAGRYLFVSGYDRVTGESVTGTLARRVEAVPPASVMRMLSGPGGDSRSGAKPSYLVSPPDNPQTRERDVKEFTQEDFRSLLDSPGRKLHPDRPAGDAALVMFTWKDCPSCEGMREYFLLNRERTGIQVLFVPIAGGRKYDKAALEFLGDSPASEEAGILEKLHVSTEILGSRTGKVRVPAFAWREADGSVRIGNPGANEFRGILERLAITPVLP